MMFNLTYTNDEGEAYVDVEFFDSWKEVMDYAGEDVFLEDDNGVMWELTSIERIN